MNRRSPRVQRGSRSVAVLVVVSVVSVASIAACGGRVDGVSTSAGSSGTSGSSGSATSTPGQRPPGSRPPGGRPPAAPLTAAAVASSIAEDYCKTFSSCCVGIGQPPIDVARCRELTSTALEKELTAAGATESSVADLEVCVGAIHDRTAACGKEDVRWPGADVPIFAPASVQEACAPLLPDVAVPTAERCSATLSCSSAGTCAIDECSAAPAIGGACPAKVCLDSADCVGGTCVAGATADVSSGCKSDVDCRLGLVCFNDQCATAREHPGAATQRSSPYRIGADTCRAYTYL